MQGIPVTPKQPSINKQTSSSNEAVYTSVDALLRLRHVCRDLTLTARKRSQALLEGAVRTRYQGRGMEFAEVRPYQAGDDIRTIDWRVTARMQSPYTKLFQEERERPIFVMVDQRSPMFFGSQICFKSVYAAQIATAIAWIANNNSDRIGALVFGDQEQGDIRARRSKHSVLELTHQLVDFNSRLTTPVSPPESRSLYDMLTETSRIARPGSLVIVLSDFHDLTPECAKPLSRLGKRSDVMALHIYDPLERQLPPVNQLAISNGSERITINTTSVSERFKSLFDVRQQELRQTCVNSGVQYVNVPIHQPVENLLRDLFSAQRKRSRGAQ